jgi:hypothetical protein
MRSPRQGGRRGPALGAAYEVEVRTRKRSGNQTITEVGLTTRG